MGMGGVLPEGIERGGGGGGPKGRAVKRSSLTEGERVCPVKKTVNWGLRNIRERAAHNWRGGGGGEKTI